ncbi:hypothetical protein F3Y22_tig00116951pilonHSYRG00655 [Hibiscus syriacus]|uniref:RNase H type-1 domain-containing protein n=1 Tax=Hibiscus syriacus TaxID=106335 RepID=A0A6A2X0I5_HIBSY|nr:hypothetical protein F3Y22_tig00116951pilonHSYRG00655 [Hibiscus syriacus]
MVARPVFGSIQLHFPQASVRDLITSDGYWHVQHLRQLLPTDLVQRVLGTPPPLDDLGKDLSVWRWDQSGLCFVKSAFMWNDIMDYHWRHHFGILIWKLWKHRNNVVFNGQIDASFDLLLSPPPPGVLKLNTDGAMQPSSMKTASGGVFRDENGKWIVGYSRRIGKYTALQDELWAVGDDLELAWQHSFRYIVIITDNIQVVCNLNSPPQSFEPMLLRRIRALLNRSWSVRISHTPKEANRLANYLARMGYCRSMELSTLTQPPQEAHHVFNSDMPNILDLSTH